MKNIVLEDFVGFCFDRVVWSIPIICVCYNPSDFPGKYTARVFAVEKPSPYVVVKDTLDEIRKVIPKERFVNVGRKPEDDPVIVEAWL